MQAKLCTLMLLFVQAALEEEWQASDSACFPSQTQPLPNQLHRPKVTCPGSRSAPAWAHFLGLCYFAVINNTIY